MTLTVFGIANCDTVRKARRWLDQHRVEYDFHDYRKQGITPGLLAPMESALGWEAMINRRGTTWRTLDAARKRDVERDSALRLMLDYPALIRRPILRRDGRYHLGFDPARYRELFESNG